MKTKTKDILDKILNKMKDKGYSQVEGYNKFTLVEYDENKLIIGREKGKDTPIYYNKILHIIEEYQKSPDDYDLGPSKTRDYGLIHLNSPIWSMLHLLDKSDYE